MRSNPLDNKLDPKGALVLAIGGAAMVALGIAGFAANVHVTHARTENVRAAVIAAGYGDAAVRPIRGDECWRSREGFTWKTASASGSACAGPRAEVQLFPGVQRPHL